MTDWQMRLHLRCADECTCPYAKEMEENRLQAS
jgi:hypothetical protein